MTLLFLHIPKTGGTAIRRAMEKIVPLEERIYVYDPAHMPTAVTPESLAAMSDAMKRSFRLVTGHFEYGIHASIPQPAKYVTVLREPVDRLISMYTFYQRQYPYLVRDRSILEWAEMSRQGDNEMVRRIAGRLPDPIGTCTAAMFHTAVKNIERDFIAVLLTEELDSSYRTLGRLLGAELPPPGHVNVSPERTSVDAGVRDRLAEMNPFDVALYEYAKGQTPATPPAFE